MFLIFRKQFMNIYISRKNLKSIPKEYSGTTVKGSFHCRHNKLTSLAGGPEIVNTGLYCLFNNLFSLDNAPIFCRRIIFREFRV